MTKVPYGVEILPKISIVWVGRTNVTDRQTDDRQTDGRTMTYSEHELEFTFAKNEVAQWLSRCVTTASLISTCWNTSSLYYNPYSPRIGWCLPYGGTIILLFKCWPFCCSASSSSCWVHSGVKLVDDSQNCSFSGSAEFVGVRVIRISFVDLWYLLCLVQISDFGVSSILYICCLLAVIC